MNPVGTRAHAAPAVTRSNDIAYLEAVELSLLENIDRLNARLTKSRKSGHIPDRVRGSLLRRSRGGSSPCLASSGRAQQPTPHGLRSTDAAGEVRQRSAAVAATGAASAPGAEGAVPAPAPLRQRIITVSLYLPTKADRRSARQQLFDARLPPKGMFALENASNVPFVWVGAPDPTLVGHSKNPELFEDVYGTRHGSTRLMEDPGEVSPHRQASYVVPVSLPVEEPALLANYAMFCDKTLWNLLHYDYSSLATDDQMGDSEALWNAYTVVNQRFAEAVSEIYEEGDLIWVHNYHLMLLPAMLRQRLWYAKIGYFLYAPFPSAEIFRILPFRTEILKGVLGADLVGFHTFDYSKQFSSSCTRLLGLEGTPKGIEVEPRATRCCEFGIYPAGIDVRDLKMRVCNKQVKSRALTLKKRFGDRMVIVGVDRLDDAFSGIPLKLLAFERFLLDNPTWRRKVVLVQVAMLPPKHAGKTSDSHRAQINEFVARINSQYGTFASSPIHYINEELDPTEVHALMCVGHVCMVSSLRDGMGLVPYEWTVCQHNGYKGCLILSEFAGAAASFSTALHVNPWNVDDVSVKILIALRMKESERAMRDASAYEFVTTHTASLWGLNFLEDLEQAGDVTAEGPSAFNTPILDAQSVLDAFFFTKTTTGTPAVPSSPKPTWTATSALLTGGKKPPMRSRSHVVPRQRFVPTKRDRSASPMPIPPMPPSRAMSMISPSIPYTPTSIGTDSGDASLLPIMTMPISAASPSVTTDGSYPKTAPPPSSRQSGEKSKKKLFVLDYDGTLVNSQAIAELVAPSVQVLDLLLRLTRLENCYVLLLSGRDRKILMDWFGHLDLFLAAEDGSFLRAPGEIEWVAQFRRTSDDYGCRHYDEEDMVPPMTPSLSFATGDMPNATSLSPDKDLSDNPNMVGMNGDDSLFEGRRHAGKIVTSSVGQLRRISRQKGGFNSSMQGDADVSPSLDADPQSSSPAASAVKVHPLLASQKRGKWSSSSFGSAAASRLNNVPEWKVQIMPIMHYFAERTPGVILEEGSASLTWHFNDADAEFGRFQARDLQKHLESFLLQHLSIEVVSEEGSSRYPTRWVKVRQSGVDKAVAVERVLERVQDLFDDSFSTSVHSSYGGTGIVKDPFAAAAITAVAAFKADKKAGVLGGDEEVKSGTKGIPVPGLDLDLAPSGLSNASKGASVVDFVFCAGDDRADEGMFDSLRDLDKLTDMGLSSAATRVFTCRIGSGATSAQTMLDSSQKLLDLLQEVAERSEKSLGYEGPGELSLRGPALDDEASNGDAPASW